jgi:acetyltransferase-like isoleucine patch superfamily enzyme
MSPALNNKEESKKEGMVGKSRVIIGSFTFGFEYLLIRQWDEGATLTIGKFCSIGDRTCVFLGGNHRVGGSTAFPFEPLFPEKFGGAARRATTKGDVVIGNDVWIGSGATIMSGVTVGDGAIIAANAHVVKNVSPYEVVGGNPAKHMKYRFNEEIRDLLLELKWWDLPVERLGEIVDDLYREPSVDLLKGLIQKFKNRPA